MTTGVDALDTSLHKTQGWLREIMEAMGWTDRGRAYSGLRAVLHALRDRLTLDEAFDLSAELPMILRGMYFEGWDRASSPTRERTRAAFLARIAERLVQAPDVDPVRLAQAVLGVLARHVCAGEVADVQGMLPREIRELWPAWPTPAEPDALEDRRTPRAALNEARMAARRRGAKTRGGRATARRRRS